MPMTLDWRANRTPAFEQSPNSIEVHVESMADAHRHQGKMFFGLIAAILLLAWGAGTFAAGAKAGAGAGEAQPAAARAGGRTPQQITSEIQNLGQDVAPLFASPQDLFEPAKRKSAAPKAVPALKKMVKLLDELIASRPAGSPQGQERTQLMALLSALGDKEATDRLRDMAASPVAGDAAAGRSAQLFAAWLLTDGKAPAQEKVVDDLAALAAKYPAEPSVAGAAIMLAGTTRPDAQPLRQRIAAVVTGLKSPAAATAAKQIETIGAKFEASEKLHAFEGKPIKLEGHTPAGGHASTADYQGKVVLVDFWASWCVTCKTELPKLKSFYAQYHSQGLEVLGVSCDNDGEALVKFMSQNKDMPWPQLFDASQPGWHALATQYGINAVPVMFVIDRKGVLRSVDGRDNYAKLVPELLKEPAQ